MTNQEINEAVARKLGWTLTNSFRMNPAQICKGWVGPNRYFPGELPDYCGSIQVAWEIAGKLNYFKLVFAANSWRCEMKGVKEYADTAPRAVCLAYLKLGEK